MEIMVVTTEVKRTAGVEAALADDKFTARLKESVETIEDLNRHERNPVNFGVGWLWRCECMTGSKTYRWTAEVDVVKQHPVPELKEHDTTLRRHVVHDIA